jgi:hypothetical protein
MSANLEMVGNPFLNLSDKINIDSRFVDGGFFQKKNNLLFFSGMYYIHKLEHKIVGNSWTTNYDLMSFGDLKSKTYETSISKFEPPAPADAALMAEAKSNSVGSPNKDAKPADAKKTKPDKKKSKSKTSTPKKTKKKPKPATGKKK